MQMFSNHNYSQGGGFGFPQFSGSAANAGAQTFNQG